MWNKFVYSFPIQLFAMHLRRNLLMLLMWVALVVVYTGNFGEVLGIPYLFLDPEYLNRVNFWSFFIVGVSLGVFTASFNIATYILYCHRYSFIGVLERPFIKFSMNNSLLPALVVVACLVCIVRFQLENEYRGMVDLLQKTAGFLSGIAAALLVLYTYFRHTNIDIFNYLTGSVDNMLKKVKINRKKALDQLKEVRDRRFRVDYYVDEKLKMRQTEVIQDFYDKRSVLKVFDQNHFNLVVFELLIIAIMVLLGFFMDNRYFQIPAAASIILFLTIFIMLIGAITYWFRSWGLIFSVGIFLMFNWVVKTDFFGGENAVYGLEYKGIPAVYSLKTLGEQNNLEKYEHDKQAMLAVLDRWKAKQQGPGKPKMVFLCVSGGGQRAALWTMRVLQQADSLLGGKLLDKTMLITGASGGIVGAAYYRELYLRQQAGEITNRYHRQYLNKIAMDNLNPMIFSLLVNDLFIKLQYFNYEGIWYPKDRGYAFENQLNRNTGHVLEKKLTDYTQAETLAKVPLLLMAPTIVNDGRKLYVCTQDVGFMTVNSTNEAPDLTSKVRGVDFRHFFSTQGADNLRFLSALRMSATFPYITPNIKLPGYPPLEIMDAGISDNYGISDAVRFIYVFRDWMAANTSGVVILSVRDHQKNAPIEKKASESVIQTFSSPISSVYNNLGNIQDLNNDSRIEGALEWLDEDIYQVDIEYNTLFERKAPTSTEAMLQKKQNERASLNWHLTTKEKKNIIDNINRESNQKALQKLKELLTDTSENSPVGSEKSLP